MGKEFTKVDVKKKYAKIIIAFVLIFIVLIAGSVVWSYSYKSNAMVIVSNDYSEILYDGKVYVPYLE